MSQYDAAATPMWRCFDVNPASLMHLSAICHGDILLGQESIHGTNGNKCRGSRVSHQKAPPLGVAAACTDSSCNPRMSSMVLSMKRSNKGYDQRSYVNKSPATYALYDAHPDDRDRLGIILHDKKPHFHSRSGIGTDIHKQSNGRSLSAHEQKESACHDLTLPYVGINQMVESCGTFPIAAGNQNHASMIKRVVS